MFVTDSEVTGIDTLVSRSFNTVLIPLVLVRTITSIPPSYSEPLGPRSIRMSIHSFRGEGLTHHMLYRCPNLILQIHKAVKSMLLFSGIRW